MAKNLPQLPITQLPDKDGWDTLRIELEGKIKDESNTMKWYVGILVIILLAVLGYIATQLGKVDDLKQRILVLETKFDSCVGPLQKSQEELQRKIGVLETQFNSH